MISGSETSSLRTTTESKTYHPCIKPNTIKIRISRRLRTTVGSNTYTPLLRAGNQDDACLRANPEYSAYTMINRPMARRHILLTPLEHFGSGLLHLLKIGEEYIEEVKLLFKPGHMLYNWPIAEERKDLQPYTQVAPDIVNKPELLEFG